MSGMCKPAPLSAQRLGHLGQLLPSWRLPMWWPALTKVLRQAADGDTMLAGHAQVQPCPRACSEQLLRLSGHGLAGQQQRYGRSTAWAKDMLRHVVGVRIGNLEAGGSAQRQLLEYGRPGWEYHAKGIWCVPIAQLRQLLHEVLARCHTTLCGCIRGKALQREIVSVAGTTPSGSWCPGLLPSAVRGCAPRSAAADVLPAATGTPPLELTVPV